MPSFLNNSLASIGKQTAAISTWFMSMPSLEGYSKLNKSALDFLRKAVDAEPSADLESTLQWIYTSYSKLRSDVEKREKRRQGSQQKPAELAPNGTTQTSEAHIPKKLQLRVPCFSSALGASSHVVYPLQNAVMEILSIKETSCSPSIIAEALLGALAVEQPLMAGLARMVIPLGDEVIVKVRLCDDNTEHHFLSFLEDRLPSIPAPRPLGCMTIGSYSYLFMTRVPGERLEHRWPDLEPHEKNAVQSTLNDILSKLRSIQLPLGQAMGSVHAPHRCKDCRRTERISSGPFYTEAQFNEFWAASQSQSRVANGHRNWLLSMLRTDHRIVLTHGDLNLRNILVDVASNGKISIGLVDWETAGYYPEYWETLKVFNCRNIKDTSDWWEHLPSCLLGYDQEIVVDGVIERLLLA